MKLHLRAATINLIRNHGAVRFFEDVAQQQQQQEQDE